MNNTNETTGTDDGAPTAGEKFLRAIWVIESSITDLSSGLQEVRASKDEMVSAAMLKGGTGAVADLSNTIGDDKIANSIAAFMVRSGLAWFLDYMQKLPQPLSGFSVPELETLHAYWIRRVESGALEHREHRPREAREPVFTSTPNGDVSKDVVEFARTVKPV